MEYIPPIILGNKLRQFSDVKNTIGESGLNVGGYIRISTTKDVQKTSIENQKKYITEWANLNGYNIVDFYIDIKSGAYSYLRNEMSRLRNDVLEGKVKGIVSKEISRTSRDIMDVLELKRGLVEKGAFFISIKEGYDSRQDDDEFLLVIHAGLAQKERKVTSSRVKITQMIKAKEGKTNVPRPALGYMLSEDRQHMIINPDTAEIYNLIVEKFLNGWGRLKICKYLNSNNIKTNRGGSWTTNSILNILSNPVYLGVSMYNVTVRLRDSSGKAVRMVRPCDEWIVRENTHPPLISQDKFDKIQRKILERKEQDTKEWSCSKKYLLSGILYCASCGGKLYGSKIPKEYAKKIKKNERSPEDYYHYYFDKNISGTCSSKVSNYVMEVVEKKVLDAIREVFTGEIDSSIQSKQYILNSKLDKEKKERESIIDKLQSNMAALKKQQLAYEADVITLSEYKQRLDELRQQRSKLENRLTDINLKLEKADSFEYRFQAIKDKVKGFIENINNLSYELKEEIIRKTISKVTICEDYSVSIQFTFEE